MTMIKIEGKAEFKQIGGSIFMRLPSELNSVDLETFAGLLECYIVMSDDEVAITLKKG